MLGGNFIPFFQNTLYYQSRITSPFRLEIRFGPAGELDFQADEAFLEALVTFALSIPLADIWQDRDSARQQQRLLSAQFGPDEVLLLAELTLSYQHLLAQPANNCTSTSRALLRVLKPLSQAVC